MAKVTPKKDELTAKQSKTAMTAALVEELSREAEAGYDLTRAERRRVGRPSLAAGVSPRLQVRLSRDLYAAAQLRAQQEGRPVSDVAREALRQ
jgi:hypothetical protein